MFNNRVLIVCAETSLANSLATTFEANGYDVATSLSAKVGCSITRQFCPELVVVDLDLLASDGFGFCWKLRESSSTKHVRILMLSDGRGEEYELMGLSRGADDYLLKPFQNEHLMYRARVLLKQKTTHGHTQTPIRHDGLELDFNRRTALLNGFDLALTSTEFRLIWSLAIEPGIVFDRLELVNQCRGDDANCQERTIDVHIRSIRRKLGRSNGLIETVRGVGYRFRDTPALKHQADEVSAPYDEFEDRFASKSFAFRKHMAANRSRGDSNSMFAISTSQNK